MVTFAIKHLATTGTVLAGRAVGDSTGTIVPMRLHFDLRTNYTVNEENGKDPMLVDVLFPSGKYSALDYTPVWEHHRFYGWYTTAVVPSFEEDNTGTRIQPSDAYAYEQNSIYARWQTPATVTFDATSGGGTMPGGWTAPDYYVGQPFAILPQPTKSGETFLGWFLSNGTRITEKTTVPSGTVTLLARYAAVTYATTFEVQITSSYNKFGIYSTTARDVSAPTVVDWGDGTRDVVYGNVSQLVHEYSTAGTYEVGISDSITSFGISANNSTWYGTTAQVRYTMKRVKTLSSSIATYPSYAFYNCSAMTDTLLPSNQSFTNIPSYCFGNCTSLKNVTIPSTVTTISSYAFYYCQSSNFNTITIPATVTSIQDFAFYYCYYLNNITFASGGSLSLGTYAFAYCGYYSNFDIDLSPRIITSIPNYCFYYCRYLRNFTFPQGVTSIGSYTFRYAFYQSTVGSPTVTIPEGVTSINTYAFADTLYLAAIVIPSTCTTIGTYAFYSATRLATITINRSTAPTVQSTTFGDSTSYYTGRTYYSAGTNKLIIPAGATGYASSYWVDPLCNSSRCGFHIEYYGGTEASITFDATTNGGQMPPDWVAPKYYDGCMYLELPVPTHPTLSFGGWYDENDNKVTEYSTVVDGVTLTAKYVASTFTVNLNNQWRLSTTQTNPDSTLYDGVYESYSNYNVNNGYAKMYINVVGYTSFRIYIRSYAESNYDYTIAFEPDVDVSSLPSDKTSGAKASTKGSQQSGQAISNYTAVDYALDGGSHSILICYRKDSSQHTSDDRGYVLIPKNQ